MFTHHWDYVSLQIKTKILAIYKSVCGIHATRVWLHRTTSHHNARGNNEHWSKFFSDPPASPSPDRLRPLSRACPLNTPPQLSPTYLPPPHPLHLHYLLPSSSSCLSYVPIQTSGNYCYASYNFLKKF